MRLPAPVEGLTPCQLPSALPKVGEHDASGGFSQGWDRHPCARRPRAARGRHGRRLAGRPFEDRLFRDLRRFRRRDPAQAQRWLRGATDHLVQFRTRFVDGQIPGQRKLVAEVWFDSLTIRDLGWRVSASSGTALPGDTREVPHGELVEPDLAYRAAREFAPAAVIVRNTMNSPAFRSPSAPAGRSLRRSRGWRRTRADRRSAARPG
jgi:hypothetical protein